MLGGNAIYGKVVRGIGDRIEGKATGSFSSCRIEVGQPVEIAESTAGINGHDCRNGRRTGTGNRGIDETGCICRPLPPDRISRVFGEGGVQTLHSRVMDELTLCRLKSSG